jgi:hypothetical protein
VLGDGADPTPSDIDTLAPLLEEVTRIHGARALERELGLTPLRSRTRDREEIPPRAADCEAHHGVDRFARWARRNLRPALRTTELRSWGDVYDVCSRFGVVIRPYANGLVFEDVKCGVHVKASFVGTQRREAWSSYRNSASRERAQLKRKYHLQRSVIAALPVAGRDRKQLRRQLALRQTIETRALKRKLAIQRSAIQKTWHPGTWRQFIASSAAKRDARAIRLLQRRERERDRSSEEREL